MMVFKVNIYTLLFCPLKTTRVQKCCLFFINRTIRSISSGPFLSCYYAVDIEHPSLNNTSRHIMYIYIYSYCPVWTNKYKVDPARFRFTDMGSTQTTQGQKTKGQKRDKG